MRRCFQLTLLLSGLISIPLCARLPFTEADLIDTFFQDESLDLQTTELLAYTIVNKQNNDRSPPTKPPSEFQLSRILELEGHLKENIHGQNQAIEATVQALVRYAAGLSDPDSPIANLLYIGPTGVGKTELAKQLAIELTGSKNNLIRFDMSEYAEPHTVSKLIGTPPGYVGYDRGGLLTQAIKNKPNAIILLDEVEKAHPNVMQVFLQAFDDARITDTKGEVIDCHRCLFILTTNLAAPTILQLEKAKQSSEDILRLIQPQLMSHLSPELFNRIEPVIFHALTQENFLKIAQSQLNQVTARLQDKKQINLHFDNSVITYLCQKGYSFELGARPLKRLIDREIVTPLGYALFQGKFSENDDLQVTFDGEKISLRKSNNRRR